MEQLLRCAVVALESLPSTGYDSYVPIISTSPRKMKCENCRNNRHRQPARRQFRHSWAAYASDATRRGAREIPMSRVTPALRSFAEQLLAREAKATKSSTSFSGQAFPVIEKLRPHLTNLLGKTGFRALLARAITATPKCGEITTSAGVDNGKVEITVADNGKGCRPEEIANLFDAFGKAASSSGRVSPADARNLMLTKLLVEKQGGELLASSPGPGCGTTFTLRMPCVDG